MGRFSVLPEPLLSLKLISGLYATVQLQSADVFAQYVHECFMLWFCPYP